MKNLKKNNGITLVALVVTIVVMLILAGVSINIMVGDNGMLTKAQGIKENIEKAEAEGQERINSLQKENYIKDGVTIINDENAPTINSMEVTDITDSSFTVKVTVTETGSGLAKIEYSIDDGETYITPNYDKARSYTFENLEAGIYKVKVRATDSNSNYSYATQTVEIKISNVDGVKIPEGFYYVGGTKNSGLVISDNIEDQNRYKGSTTVGIDLQGNQFVWIEVPKTTMVYPTAGLGITTFDDTAYTNIENDLHTYTSTYRNGTSYTDTYYPDTDNTDWFANETEYNTAKHNMLKSVYQNGGFYVGRYETGIAYDDINGSRNFGTEYTTLHEAIQTPVIKANAYPYNWVRRAQAQVLASNMYSGDRTSSLMFGVQWDLVLAFTNNKGGVENSILTIDSKNIGNYSNATFDVTNTNAKYAIYSKSNYTLSNWNSISTSYTKPDSGTENWILLTTGANETRNSNMNICDLAGNLWEWTLEKTSDNSSPCAMRGGCYTDGGSFRPTFVRVSDSTTGGDSGRGFRVSLY